MSPSELIRLPTRAGWTLVVALVAGLVALALVASGWNRLTAWWPWSLQARLERAETRADRAELAAVRDRLTAEGQTRQVARIERHTREVITLREIASDAHVLAHGAPDADTPLDPARHHRLSDADRRLCQAYAAPGCPAPDQPAPGGD